MERNTVERAIKTDNVTHFTSLAFLFLMSKISARVRGLYPGSKMDKGSL